MSILGGVVVPHPPLIVPAIGKGRELDIKDTVNSYEKAASYIKSLEPETIVIISPHSEGYGDYFEIYDGDKATGDFSRFGAGNVKFEVSYDREFISELNKKIEDLPGGTSGKRDKALDHGMMVPLYFINKYLSDYKIVRIALSGLSMPKHYQLGMYIKEVAEELNRKVAVVASGDLSHKLTDDGPYGYSPEALEYDKRVMDDLANGNFLNLFEYDEEFLDKAAICGHNGFCILGGCLDRFKLEIERLSYEGPFGVGYGTLIFKIIGEDSSRNYYDIWYNKRLSEIKEIRDKEDPFVNLARRAVEEYVSTGNKLRLDSVPEGMDFRSGVFVSIHENGALRGCIGTIDSMYSNIAREIIGNAISACSRDNRFLPVEKDELPFLDYSVDVLGEKIPCTIDELDPKKYGIVIEKDGKRGVLLPNLDGIDTVDEQVSITLRKAGLSEDEENYTIKKFEVVRHY